MEYAVIGCAECGYRTTFEGDTVEFLKCGETHKFEGQVCPNTDCNAVEGDWFIDDIRDDDGYD